MSDSAEWQAGFQAGLGRLEGFKEAVQLQRAHQELVLKRYEDALTSAAGKLAVLRLLLAAYPDNELAAECRKHGLDVP